MKDKTILFHHPKSQQLIDTLLHERDEAREQVAHLLLEKAESEVASRDKIYRLTRELEDCRSRTR